MVLMKAGRALCMKYVASIDQGTSSTRVVVYDSDFRTVRVATRHLKTHAPQPGWLEMHGSDILSSVEACLEEACAGLEISCVGIANQRETTLALDSQTGEALSPAILWSDTRTADICEEWKKQENSGWLLQQTGLPFSPYFSASKMLWLLKNNEAVQQSAVEGRLAFATVDAYLLRHLTGVLSTDGTNASRTMLMGLKELAWSSEAVSFCGVGAFQLPQLKPSIGDFGEIVRGPLKGVRVTGVLGDQQAALLGQGCTREGESKCTFGTGAFLLQHVGGEPHEGAAETGLVSTVAVHRQEQGKTTYAVEGSVGAAGSVVTWLRDQMGILPSYGALDGIAESVADTGGVTVVPAFGGLLAPHWRSDARACVLGLSLASSRAHMVRACLEGVANSVADVVSCLPFSSSSSSSPLLVDGGLAASRVLLQMVADCSGRAVMLAQDTEATARGAAVAAGAGAGWWELERAREDGERGESFRPKTSQQEREKNRQLWHKHLKKTMP